VSSRDGLARADVDTGLYADPKVKALARLQRDPVRTAATMTLYLATVLESWAENDRVSVEDAMPAWYLADYAEMVTDLTTVGLLADDGMIPEPTLDRWLSGIRARTASGRAAADRRWHGNGSAMGTQSARNTQPASLPEKPARSAPAKRERDDPRSLREILRETTGEPNIVKGDQDA
jgi:hypothetical protein